jgi:membrane associated rhomboid family serine protease
MNYSVFLILIVLVTLFQSSSSFLKPYSFLSVPKTVGEVYSAKVFQSNQSILKKEKPRIVERFTFLQAQPRNAIYGYKNTEILTPTNIILGLNAISFLLTMNNPRLRFQFTKVNQRIARGEYYRLLTSLFLHGSVPHLLSNSYSLYSIGNQVRNSSIILPFLFT